jgi:hypothetical protein
VISAGLSAIGNYLNAIFPGAQVLLAVANFVVSLVLLAAVFAAIFNRPGEMDSGGEDHLETGRNHRDTA